MPRRDPLAVTGIGVIAPPGVGPVEFWHGVLAGRGNFRPVRAFDPSPAATHMAGYPPGAVYPEDLGVLATHAVAAALEDARVDTVHALAIGLTGAVDEVAADAYSQYVQGHSCAPREALLAETLARAFRVGGPCTIVAGASAASANAVAYMAEVLDDGLLESGIVVGCDTVSRASFFGLNALRVLSRDGCRPFCRERRGIWISQAGAALVLEKERRARARGAEVRAWLVGAAVSNHAAHPVQPDTVTIEASLQGALHDAGLSPGDIDYVNAHAPGTPTGDEAELAALRRVFGSAPVAIGSTKGTTGHCQGAAGVVEAAIAALAVQTHELPPTTRALPLDPACGQLDIVTARRTVSGMRYALSISSGLGGVTCCLIFGAPEMVT